MTQKQDEKNKKGSAQPKQKRDPVRTWTYIIFAVCALLIAWYIGADRVTPFTSQARVNALVVPIAPQVSGVVTEVEVKNNQVVEDEQVLFRIDDRNYRLELQAAEAQYAGAQQAMAAARTAIDGARAQVGSAEANLERSRKDADRMRNIKKQDEGAISQRRLAISQKK